MDLGKRAPEADVASGVIRITINGQEKVLPTLKIGPFEDEWLPAQTEVIKRLFEEDREPAELFKIGMGSLIDAIVAYDTTGALGGREWLRANADHADLHNLVHEIWDRHLKGFMKDVQGLMGAVRQMNQAAMGMAVMQRLQEPSSSSPSPSGDSTPPDSGPH